jgi:hypothetical protein
MLPFDEFSRRSSTGDRRRRGALGTASRGDDPRCAFPRRDGRRSVGSGATITAREARLAEAGFGVIEPSERSARRQPNCGAGRPPDSAPREIGGNIDIKQLYAGSILALPVDVPGALFSAGTATSHRGTARPGRRSRSPPRSSSASRSSSATRPAGAALLAVSRSGGGRARPLAGGWGRQGCRSTRTATTASSISPCAPARRSGDDRLPDGRRGDPGEPTCSSASRATSRSARASTFRIRSSRCIFRSTSSTTRQPSDALPSRVGAVGPGERLDRSR